MDRQNARDQLKGYLKPYVEKITKKSKGRNMYVCPLCHSGTGPNGTGAFSIYNDGENWKCFVCREGGDIFDLIGAVEKIEDYNEQLKRAGEIFRIDIDHYHAPGNQKQAKSKQNTQSNIHNNTNTTTQDKEEPDYTDFYSQAHKAIGETPYHRGLTMETIDRFNLGYVPNWRHPKAHPSVPTSPRLIIPTSKHSYLARDTRSEIPPEQVQYAKSKVGKVRIFNSSVLYEATKPIFVVEGEIDALSIIDVGGEAIALGSTANQRALLTALESRKPAQPLIIAMDNDDAGSKANKELAEGLEQIKIPFYRIDITQQHKDANEALNADRDAFRAAVEQAIEQVKNEEDATLEAEREALKKESVASSLQDFLKNIEDSKRAAYIPTGFDRLDSILDGGLYAGLYVVGAISSLGKTTFCLQIADQVAAAGHNVLVFSLEMARNELIAKSISRMTFIRDKEETGSSSNAKTTRGILTGTRYDSYSHTEIDLINQSVEDYKKFAKNIFITEGIGNVGVEEIRAKVQKHIKLTGKAPVVVIDYLQIIAPADMRATDKQNTDRAVLELKRLSRDFNIPIIGISSFNRDNYTAPVNLASFKESGAIEYSSDVLIGLQYEGMDYKEEESDKAREKRIREMMKQIIEDGRSGRSQKIQVKILKNRNGSKGDVLMDFYPMFNYFTAQAGSGRSTVTGGWKKSESSYGAKSKSGKPDTTKNPSAAGFEDVTPAEPEDLPF